MKRMITASTQINPFKMDTGVSYYNNFLNEKDLKYMQKAKNRTGEVVMMTPNEYFEECATNIFKNVSVEGLKQQRLADTGLVAQYASEMKRGDKFPLCYLNYADAGQEGLHRMMAAGDAFGWDTKFPVLVVEVIDQREEDLSDIWRWWCRAVSDAEDMTYSADNWEEEFVEEVEYNLEKFLDEHHDVIITHRRSAEEMDEYDSDYAIEIALAEFEDIMRPYTVFTPRLSHSSDIDEMIRPDDLDDLDDLDDIDIDDI